MPRSGWIASCPPSGAADRPGAPDVARLGALGVVPSLAVRLRRSGGSAAGRRRRSRARRARGRPRRRPPGRPTSAGRARTRRSRGHARARRRSRAWARCVRRRDGRPRRAAAAASRHSSTRAVAEERLALRELAGEIGLPGGDLAVVLVEPAGVAVDPRLDLEPIAARPRPRRTSPRSGRCRATTSGSSRQRPRGRRWRTTARSGSWPSRTIVAVTSTRSPTHAFAGQRPQSTLGVTSAIVIRSAATHGTR